MLRPAMRPARALVGLLVVASCAATLAVPAVHAARNNQSFTNPADAAHKIQAQLNKRADYRSVKVRVYSPEKLTIKGSLYIGKNFGWRRIFGNVRKVSAYRYMMVVQVAGLAIAPTAGFEDTKFPL